MASLALAFDIIAKDKASKQFGDVGDASEKTGGKIGKLGPIAAAAGAAIATAAVAAGAALFKIGGAFDESYDKIRIGTGATGQALDGLKNDFKAVVKDIPTDFGSASTAIADINTRLGLTGKPLQEVSKQFLELSRLTGTDLASNIDSGTAALNGFGLSAEDQPKALDALFRASQASGVSFGDLTSQLASTGTTLRAVGFDFNESASLVAVLGKAGLSTSDVLPALSRSMAEAAKSGKSAGAVFKETFDRIKGAPSDTAAAGVALEVFGAKGGPKLAAMIREGKLSLDDMLKTVSGGSETIMAASEDTQDFGEKLTILKNNVLVALEPVATRVFDSVGRAVARVLPIMQALWERHGPAVKEALQTVSRFVQDQVVPVLRTMAEFVQTRVLPVLQGLAGHILGGLQSAFNNIRDKINENRPQLASLVEAFKSVAEFVVTKIVPLLGPVLATAFKHLGQTIGTAIDVIAGIVKIFTTVKDTATSVLRTVIDVFAGFVETLVSGAAKAFGWVPGLGDKLKSASRSVEGFRDDANRALNGVKDVVAVSADTRAAKQGIDQISTYSLNDRALRVSADTSAAKRGIDEIISYVGKANSTLTVNVRQQDQRGDGPGRPPGGGGSTLNRVMPVLNRLGGYVTSTYRSPAENARVGGSLRSYHLDASNPAVDIGGTKNVLDRVHAALAAAGGWRELLWQVKGHYDHVHVAHDGGRVSASWPTLPGLRSDERPAILQVGETVVPVGGAEGGRGATYVVHAHQVNPTPGQIVDALRTLELLHA
jgi:TP901 family phage tail tape measure protein